MTDQHPRVEEFREQARERHGFDPAVEEFSEGTKTAADAANAIGCDVAQIASSIAVSTASDELAVVVTSGANRVDLQTVADLLEVSSVSMADAYDVRETLGWSIGGVPPFCHATAVPVLVDDTLFEHDQVWAAAGTPEAVFPVTPAEILAYSGGRRATVHESET